VTDDVEFKRDRWACTDLMMRSVPGATIDAHDALAALVADLFRRPTWQARASCRGDGPHNYFPARGGGAARQLAAARAVCSTCPVAEQCRADAIDDPNRVGVWGGLTPGERAKIRRAGQRAHDLGEAA
jgi:WhiB family redox-sensing transcriptional regulator